MTDLRLRKLLRFALVLYVATFAGTRAQAADYPTKAIQVIVPFAGGSANDVDTRIILNEMPKALGQNFPTL